MPDCPAFKTLYEGKEGYTLPICTAGREEGYILHVHTAYGRAEYTLHVHTADGVGGYTHPACPLSIHQAVERDTYCTSTMIHHAHHTVYGYTLNVHSAGD
jgi:hypothetical protein